MGKEYTEIDERIQNWITRQKVYFVATAPLAADGHINCSPKGLDSLRVLGPHKLAYVDFGGSGAETAAHVRENERIVIMLCAFDGPPKIYRFYGRGSVVEPGDAGFDALLAEFSSPLAARNIVCVDVDKIMDSCGYGVPQYEFKSERESLRNWYDKKSEEDILNYRRENNRLSLDGLPALKVDGDSTGTS